MVMSEPAIKLSPEAEAAVLKHLDAARRHTAVEAVENMLREIQAGNVEVIESEVNAPPAADGEVTIEFKFRLKAAEVSSSPSSHTKYKKYIWFKMYNYYPSGGLGDIKDSFDSLDEAIAAVGKPDGEDHQIVDRDTWETVWSQ